MKKTMIALLAVLALSAFISCEKDVPPVRVGSVAFTEDAPRTMTVGDRARIHAEVLPLDAAERRLVWTSTDPDTVSVDINGTVEALAPGKATVRAEAKDGFRAYDSIEITVVPVEVTGIVISGIPGNVTVDSSFRLKAEITPFPARGTEVTWRSSDETVLTVDGNGNVEVLAPGEAEITAEAGTASASISFTVLRKPSAEDSALIAALAEEYAHMREPGKYGSGIPVLDDDWRYVSFREMDGKSMEGFSEAFIAALPADAGISVTGLVSVEPGKGMRSRIRFLSENGGSMQIAEQHSDGTWKWTCVDTSGGNPDLSEERIVTEEGIPVLLREHRNHRGDGGSVRVNLSGSFEEGRDWSVRETRETLLPMGRSISESVEYWNDFSSFLRGAEKGDRVRSYTDRSEFLAAPKTERTDIVRKDASSAVALTVSSLEDPVYDIWATGGKALPMYDEIRAFFPEAVRELLFIADDEHAGKTEPMTGHSRLVIGSDSTVCYSSSIDFDALKAGLTEAGWQAGSNEMMSPDCMVKVRFAPYPGGISDMLFTGEAKRTVDALFSDPV